MCMLTYIPANVQPDVEALTNGTEFNRDGHGYAIVVPGKKPRLIIRHGLDATALIAQFAKDRAKHPGGPALFHSRFGTSGSGGKFNCHPFYVNGDKQTIVAHNGVLPATMQPSRGDKRCDTRMAAEELFGRAYGHLGTSQAREALGAAITTANKLVILTVNPAYDQHAYVINEQVGIWDGGIWYSNYDYQGRYTVPATAKGWSTWSDWDYEDCAHCGSLGAIDDYGICTMCDTCSDCGEVDDCLCYYATEQAEQDDEDERKYLAWLESTLNRKTA